MGKIDAAFSLGFIHKSTSFNIPPFDFVEPSVSTAIRGDGSGTLGVKHRKAFYIISNYRQKGVGLRCNAVLTQWKRTFLRGTLRIILIMLLAAADRLGIFHFIGWNWLIAVCKALIPVSLYFSVVSACL